MTTTIIGAGIAGLTTAIALKNIGVECHIFESAPEVKAIGAGLALAANAIKGLQQLGIAEAVIDAGRILPSFTIYDEKGAVITHTDCEAVSKKYGINNFTIHRAALHEVLYRHVNPNAITLNKKAVDIKQSSSGVTILFSDGTEHQTDYLIVADGIHSSIRQKLNPHSRPHYAGYTCWRAVINNTHLQLQETSETWSVKGRFGIAPLAQDQLYWFACINGPQNSSVFKNYTTTDLWQHFKDFKKPIPQIIQATRNKDLIWNDIIYLKPLQQYAYNNVVLIGDAAHATTPNMGQGACQAIEDAVILAEEWQRNSEVPAAFGAFEKRRLKRTHYITNQSTLIGKVAQTQSRPLAAIRNWLLRSLPGSISQKQLEKLYEVDF